LVWENVTYPEMITFRKNVEALGMLRKSLCGFGKKCLETLFWSFTSHLTSALLWLCYFKLCA